MEKRDPKLLLEEQDVKLTQLIAAAKGCDEEAARLEREVGGLRKRRAADRSDTHLIDGHKASAELAQETTDAEARLAEITGRQEAFSDAVERQIAIVAGLQEDIDLADLRAFQAEIKEPREVLVEGIEALLPAAVAVNKIIYKHSQQNRYTLFPCDPKDPYNRSVDREAAVSLYRTALWLANNRILSRGSMAP
jgi:hypothetical protein